MNASESTKLVRSVRVTPSNGERIIAVREASPGLLVAELDANDMFIVQDGRWWVTFAGDGADYVMGPSDVMIAKRAGRVVAQLLDVRPQRALDATTARLTEPTKHAELLASRDSASFKSSADQHGHQHCGPRLHDAQPRTSPRWN